jgi:diaminohydroxyphosphoribosylaminopyrimidine deaminase / 5-amino-6-(5-phosphoribosylamino)uracil reductase
VGNRNGTLTPIDRLFLERTYELAARGLGGTLPNPPVGALVVRDGEVVGEGHHHRAGEPHAESQALQRAGSKAYGATLYVSLEPCRHVGRTPPCTDAVIASGVARVVAGTYDPAGHGGAAQLRERGIEVTVHDDPAARDLIEVFARTLRGERPYVALKMAASLDGFVTSRHGVRERLGSPQEERYVRDLRTAYDAVMVGAGTVRIDDPMLTVRPAHDRARPYVRVVVCDRDTVPPESRVFNSIERYDRTIVLVPRSASARFEALQGVGDVVELDSGGDGRLDLTQAMRALRERGILSVLCEGGPQLGASLIAAGLIDRIYWAIAPRFLGSPHAVPALCGADLTDVALQFDRAERAGPDVIISALVTPSVSSRALHPERSRGTRDEGESNV